MKKAAIGVDIGGGSIKLGVVDERGRLHLKQSFRTDSVNGKDAQIELLIKNIKVLSVDARKAGFVVGGVGVGAPGPIDVEKGFVYFFPNIPGWKNTPLKTILEKKLKCLVRVDNDANAMALAEFTFGAGKNCRAAIALTLGTGIGGGILLDGKLFHGPEFSAAEIGHLIINEKGPLCACGNHGCIETYVGTRYFVAEVRRRMEAGAQTILKNWLKEKNEALSPYLVKMAAKKGDHFSKSMWRDTGNHLGTALAGLVNILNPERIILGGGIAEKADILFNSVRDTIRKKSFPVASRSVKVVPAFFGEEAGIIGAASLVLNRK